MSIAMRKKTILTEYRYEKAEISNSDALNESLHTFSKQHEISEYIAGILVEYIKLNRGTCDIDISRYGIACKKLIVNIVRENLIAQVSAKINEIDTDGNASMLLNIYKHTGLMGYSDKQLFYQIKEAVMHEIGHWYFILTKYKNSGDVDTTSSNPLYLEVSRMINDENVDGDVYDLAYAIYSIFGNELNAFVSQCHTQIYDYIVKRRDVDINTVKDALHSSEVYATFNTNLENIKDIIGYSTKEKNIFINMFNNALSNESNKIKSIDELDKLLKFAFDRNEEAMRMCSQTAVDAYYKFKGI